MINGCDSSATPPLFCPNDPTLRDQMAALIVRAIPAWAGETGLPNFTDNTADTELMTRVGTLQRHGVVRGYQDEVCTGQGKTPPCYGPLDTVKYGQVLLFIARAMVAKGYWTLPARRPHHLPRPERRGRGRPDHRPADARPPGGRDLRPLRGQPARRGRRPRALPARRAWRRGGWGDDSTRAWFARAFWPAIQGH